MRRLLTPVAPARSRLLVLAAPQPAARLSARNLPRVPTITTENINVYDLLRHERVVMSLGAVRVLEARYGGEMAESAAPVAESAAPVAESAATPATIAPPQARAEEGEGSAAAAEAPGAAEMEKGASPDA